MQTDLLNTVLELFQNVHDAPKSDQIVGTTVSLLATLTNPLNLGVLTGQVLAAPAIWHRGEGLGITFRVINIFNSAALRVRKAIQEPAVSGQPSASRLSCDEWARAVVKGCDEYSSRWQHLLVLTGILMGMDGEGHDAPGGLSRGLRKTLEQAVVTATNLSLERPMRDGPAASSSIVVAMSFILPHLGEFSRNSINCSALLPLAVQTMVGPDGYDGGAFISAVGAELGSQQGPRIQWPQTSLSFRLLRELESRPMVRGMGACVKVAVHAIQQARDVSAVFKAQDELLVLSRRILDTWQSTILSAMEPAEERGRLSDETLAETWPVFWDMLKKIMYTAVAMVQAFMGRCILDGRMGSAAAPPAVAAKSLHILRNLFFISSREGNANFQVYSFAYLTSIDVLSWYPDSARSLLLEIKSNAATPVPIHALHRNLDLFYLNLAEHLPLTLSTDTCDVAIVQPALNYLSQALPVTPLLRELFEGAHCALLSVLSCPHNSPLAIKLVPFYVDNLFSSFPEHISPRQFRIALKTVMQIVSPPFPVSATNPELSEILLEMVRSRSLSASGERLAPALDALDQPPVSEQSTLVIALVDSLPFLPLPLMEEWLTTSSKLMPHIVDAELRLPVWKRFWEVLESGEMDVERSFIAMSWWYSGGGRDGVFAAQSTTQVPLMSGAIVTDRQHESRSNL